MFFVSLSSQNLIMNLTVVHNKTQNVKVKVFLFITNDKLLILFVLHRIKKISNSIKFFKIFQNFVIFIFPVSFYSNHYPIFFLSCKPRHIFYHPIIFYHLTHPNPTTFYINIIFFILFYY